MKHIFILVANTRWSDQVVGRRETKTSIQLDYEKPFTPWMKLEISVLRFTFRKRTLSM